MFDRGVGQEGMNIIKVKKDELLRKLIDNRDKHVSEYEDAVKGFKQSVIDELAEYLNRATAGENITTKIVFDEPSCHEEDYDTVIEMLQMTVENEIYISMGEFRKYVQDKWNWKDGFSLTNSKYIG